VAGKPDSSSMRVVPLLILIGAACCAVPATAEDRTGQAFGIWKVNLRRSIQPYRNDLVVRFEPHIKGEVFTVDRVGGDGRVTSTSTILYLDGEPRDFEDFGCSGTQSSERVDNRTVEIRRKCAGGEWTQFVRQLTARPTELVLKITEQQPDGRRLERRLVLEKQEEGGK
jgi:hypothetical protein